MCALKNRGLRKEIYLVGFPKSNILGSKLPSNADVLRLLLYKLRIEKLNLQQSAKSTIKECLNFWNKARIPTKYKYRCITQIRNLYMAWRKLEKNKKRVSETQRKQESAFHDELDNLFDISHANALNMIKINEDREFLQQQRKKGRPGCMLGFDIALKAKEKRKAERENKIAQQHCRQEKLSIAAAAALPSLEEDMSLLSDSLESLFIGPSTSKHIEPALRNEKIIQVNDMPITGKKKENILEENEDENHAEESIKKVQLKPQDLALFSAREIDEFITPASLNLFRRFGIDCGFLKCHPSEWKNREDYLNGFKIVNSLRVVNDTAERGVKLISDFNNLITKKPHQQEYLLKVVQEYRSKYPDHNRDTLSQPYE